jgi:hypothetical protein
VTIAEEWCREVVGYLGMGRVVWRLRRVNSEQLQAQGYAALEGSEAYAAVQAEIARERKEHIAGLGQHADEAARRANIARVAEVERARTLKRLEALQSTAEGRAALLARCEAYLCASVDGVANLTTPIEEPGGVLWAAEPPNQGWEDWQWVRDERREDKPRGIVWVGRLPAQLREVLGLAVQSTQGGLTRKRVDTFRAGSGPAPAAAPPGPDLRDPPGGSPPVEP